MIGALATAALLVVSNATFDVKSPHVGKGHFTLGTNGTIGVFPGAGNNSTFMFNLGANGGYFVVDNVLVGGSLGLNFSSFSGAAGSSTSTVSLPLTAFG